MRRHLQPISDAVQQKVLILHGLGGIGKTQLALEYAKLSKDEYTAIFWLKGTNEQALDLDFASLAKRIPLPDVLDAAGQIANTTDAIGKGKTAVFRWLSQKGNCRWLIVFDDVDSLCKDRTSPESSLEVGEGTGGTAFDIRPYFEPVGQGSIIITARPTHMAQLGIGMKVDKLSADDSIEILRRTSQREVTDEGA
jgi:hypothetical protein